ncbi:MAG: response regulator [Polyangiaceae bacterium]
MIEMQGTIRVLLVDDNADDHLLFHNLLSKVPAPRCVLEWCDSFERGSAIIAERRHDLYFIDYRLGPRTGLDMMRGEPEGLSAPAVLLTADDNPEIEVAAAQSGFVDYLVKDQLSAPLLRRAIRYALSRHHAHRAAVESEARASQRAAFLNALVENAPGFYVTYLDRDGKVQFLSRVPEHCDGLVGDGGVPACTPENRRAMLAAREEVASSGAPQRYEARVRRADGSVAWFANHMGPIRDDGKITGFVVITQDITDKKDAEARMLVADRLASVGTLAAGVAHEINNPLASVVANLDLALQDAKSLAARCPVPTELLDEIGDARAAADRVRLIVRDLRVFSRAEEDRRGPVDVERVIESTLRMAWNEIRHRARLVKDYERVPAVEANESRLGQVFLNLLVNAAHAIPEGDVQANTIRISTGMGPCGRVLVRIADTGSGIRPEVMDRLFTPFFTTKPAGFGTGLGLAICHRILTGLGGEISLRSELGKGTEFTVALPACPAEPLAVVSSASSVPPPSKRGRVLVIDDDATMSRTARRILGEEHDVVVADNGRQALDLVGSGPEFDVVLCDLMMPQVSGMDFYAEMRRRDANQAARIVFVTGGAFTPRAREFLDSVTHHRLEKPFDARGLRALVNGFMK